MRYLLDSETEVLPLKSRQKLMRKWLDYWVVMTSVGTLEKVVGRENLLVVFPMWSVLKGFLIGWMLLAESIECKQAKLQNNEAGEAGEKGEAEKGEHHNEDFMVCPSVFRHRTTHGS